MLQARSFKGHAHLFLVSYFRVREHSLFGSCWSTSVVVLNSNKYYFTKMDNVRRHGLFYQNRNDFGQHNNHINSLAALAGKILRSHFAALKSCAHKISRYVGCYVLEDLNI